MNYEDFDEEEAMLMQDGEEYFLTNIERDMVATALETMKCEKCPIGRDKCDFECSMVAKRLYR